VQGPHGKLANLRRLLGGAGSSTDSEAPPSVYVGDSVTDLLAMLEADVGVVVGRSSSLRALARALGVAVLPLLAAPPLMAVQRDRGRREGVPRAIYEAPSLLDLGVYLYGRPFADFVMHRRERGEEGEQLGQSS
jgi:DNA-binding transcriptional LysR family regulator